MPKTRSLSDIRIEPKVDTVCCKNELIIFDCADKKDQEHWSQSRSFINKPRPYRLALIGPPNSGKSSICKNLILQARPEFTKVFVISNGSSKEWEDYSDLQLSVDDLQDDGAIDIFTNDVDGHRIVIIDDVELVSINKKLKGFFAMLFKHVSSHYNLSVVVSIQEYKMLPVDFRANLNVFCLSLNIRDIESISILGKKIGLSYKQFKKLFTDLKNSVENRQFSYLVIDNTTNSPVPVSLNFFQKIDLDQFE